MHSAVQFFKIESCKLNFKSRKKKFAHFDRCCRLSPAAERQTRFQKAFGSKHGGLCSAVPKNALAMSTSLSAVRLGSMPISFGFQSVYMVLLVRMQQ